MIGGKVKTCKVKTGGLVHKVVCVVRWEFTGDPRNPAPLSPIDCFAAHLPDPKKGHARRLVRARTNRRGTVLFALVRDVPV